MVSAPSFAWSCFDTSPETVAPRGAGGPGQAVEIILRSRQGTPKPPWVPSLRWPVSDALGLASSGHDPEGKSAKRSLDQRRAGTGGMNFLTDFADQAVVLPVAVVVAIVLAVMGWRRGALVWLGVLGVTFGVILVLKLGFLACGP